MDLALFAHISGGAIGLLSGVSALSIGKGAGLHKRAGSTFVISMLVMAVSGGVLAYEAGKPFDVLSSWLTSYMVLTGWISFRAAAKRSLKALMWVGGGCMVGYLSVELYAVATAIRATDAPTGAGYVFAAVLGLALIGDYKLLNRSYQSRQKKIRHLWRMNFGLLIATVSFFGARPHLFPQWMQESGVLLLLALAPVMVMVYWQIRLRPRILRHA